MRQQYSRFPQPGAELFCRQDGDIRLVFRAAKERQPIIGISRAIGYPCAFPGAYAALREGNCHIRALGLAINKQAAQLGAGGVIGWCGGQHGLGESGQPIRQVFGWHKTQRARTENRRFRRQLQNVPRAFGDGLTGR